MAIMGVHDAPVLLWFCMLTKSFQTSSKLYIANCKIWEGRVLSLCMAIIWPFCRQQYVPEDYAFAV